VFSFFEWMVAMRYLRARRQEGFISVIAWFSLLGIALGVATLIIVMSVMNGFRQELLTRILGINGHLVLQPIADPTVPGEDDHARGVAVQPMDVMDARVRGASAEVGIEEGFGCLVQDLLAGDGQQAGRLIDDDEVRIFEEDAHARIDALAAAGNLDAIVRRDPALGVALRRSVHPHAIVLQQTAQSRFRGVGKANLQDVEKSHVVASLQGPSMSPLCSGFSVRNFAAVRSLNLSRFTTVRVCVPSPINSTPSCACTAKVTVRPLTAITDAEAVTTNPTGVAARWRMFTSVPTDTQPGGRDRRMACAEATSIR